MTRIDPSYAYTGVVTYLCGPSTAMMGVEPIGDFLVAAPSSTGAGRVHSNTGRSDTQVVLDFLIEAGVALEAISAGVYPGTRLCSELLLHTGTLQ